MNISHIYLFSSFNTQGVSTRYRGTHVLKEMELMSGISHSFVYPGYKITEILRFILAFFGILFFRKRNSLIIYQKIHSKGIYTFLLKVLLKLKPGNTIYDTDDADYFRFPPENINHFMCNCGLCTVGSQALADYTREWNKNVLLLTSPIIIHNELKIKRNKILHIGWVGDYGMNDVETAPYSHKVSLGNIFFPILKDLKFEFKLTLLGIKNPKDKLEVEEYFKENTNIDLNIPMGIDWLDEIGLYRMIKDFDIGVSPMVDHEFNVAKSAFKAKQYLSCGVPVLASPIGENLKIVKDGYNGFICNTARCFRKKIIEFNEMKDTTYYQFRDNALLDIPKFRIDQYCRELLGYYSV